MEECPHGLDVSWCSLCKAKAAPPPTRRPASSSRPATRRVTSAPSRPPARESPAQALSKLRPVLFHATAYGAWDSIAAHGLRTAKQVAEGRLTRIRTDPLVVDDADGPVVTIRDQRPMIRAKIADHLDGMSLDEWLAMLNSRVFLFARQKDLTTLLGRYAADGQDVITFDTHRLLNAAVGRVEVTTVDSAAPVPWQKCPCRGRDTFVPLTEFVEPAADVDEVTVVDGLGDVTALVRRVVRYHPGGGSPEVVAGK